MPFGRRADTGRAIFADVTHRSPLVFPLAISALSATLLASCGGDSGPRYATEFVVVEVDPSAPPPFQLAVQACVGLANRDLGGSAYVRMDENDSEWLTQLELTPASVVSAADFLETCVAERQRCVRYDYEDQQALLPNILTVASALGAVPVDGSLTVACDEVAFDATTEFATLNTPLLATRYVFENYVDETTGLAMLNPGFDTAAADPANPALNGDMKPALVDFVFSQKLFVTFLVNGCTSGDPQRELLNEIVTNAPWQTPIGVYGYNNSWLVQGGYVHEAQTRCLDAHNMGAIPTETGNLSFFSTRRAPIVNTTELEHNAPEEIEYDPTKTYVAFVVGDGDNVAYILSARQQWLRQRLDDCAQTENSCAPITWSISPHLPRLAPDVLAWYYRSAASTGQDYFALPPSGHLYAYPSSLNEADQDRFAAATEADARILGTSSVVHWEWFSSWRYAESEFLPRYAHAGGAVRGVFPVNVPYLIEAFPAWDASEFYRVLPGTDGEAVVLFRSRSWRGVNDADDKFFLSPQRMADELAGYPPGTVTWVYMTSDGGLTLENSFMELVGLLPDRVQLVSADAASGLALTASGR